MESRESSNTLKKNELKVYISLTEKKWQVLQTAKAHFRYIHDKVHEVHVSSPLWCKHAPKV